MAMSDDLTEEDTTRWRRMKQEEAHLHDDVTFELLHVHNLVDKLDDVFAPQ